MTSAARSFLGAFPWVHFAPEADRRVHAAALRFLLTLRFRMAPYGSHGRCAMSLAKYKGRGRRRGRRKARGLRRVGGRRDPSPCASDRGRDGRGPRQPCARGPTCWAHEAVLLVADRTPRLYPAPGKTLRRQPRAGKGERSASGPSPSGARPEGQYGLTLFAPLDYVLRSFEPVVGSRQPCESGTLLAHNTTAQPATAVSLAHTRR